MNNTNYYLYDFDSVLFALFPDSNIAKKEIENNIERLLKVMEFFRRKRDTEMKPISAVLTFNQICDNEAVMIAEDERIYRQMLYFIEAGMLKVSTYNGHDLITYTEQALYKTLTKMVNGQIAGDECYISSLLPVLGCRLSSTNDSNDPKIAVLLGQTMRNLKYDNDKRQFYLNDVTISDDMFVKECFTFDPKQENVHFGYLTLLMFIRFLKNKIKDSEKSKKDKKLCMRSLISDMLYDKIDIDSYMGITGSLKNDLGALWEQELTSEKYIPALVFKILEINCPRIDDERLQRADILNIMGWECMNRYFTRLFTLNNTLQKNNGFPPNSKFFEDHKFQKNYQIIMRLINENEDLNNIVFKRFFGRLHSKNRENLYKTLKNIREEQVYSTRSIVYAKRTELIVKAFDFDNSNNGTVSKYREKLKNYTDFCYNVFNTWLAAEQAGSASMIQLSEDGENIEIMNFKYNDNVLKMDLQKFSL